MRVREGLFTAVSEIGVEKYICISFLELLPAF